MKNDLPDCVPSGDAVATVDGSPEHAERIRRDVSDVVNVARRLGMMDGHRRRADGIVVRCPWHREREPSCALTLGPGRKVRAYCFSCHRGGDVLSLVAAVYGLHWSRDSTRVLRLAAEKFGLWSLLFEMDHASPTTTSARERHEDRAELSDLVASGTLASPSSRAPSSSADTLHESERDRIEIVSKC